MPKSITFTANGFTYTNSEESTLNISGTIISQNYLKLPTGNTLQRPADPEMGTIRFNNETKNVEGYDGNTWINLRS